MKRLLKIFYITAVVFVFAAKSFAATPAPEITAESAILVEARTGRVIYEKNADEKRPPASMTKMLTCILGLENLSPNSEILITPTAAETESPSLALVPGDIFSAKELLTGLMLVSDNGGSVAVAQAIAGNIPRFSVMMNKKAEEIGCQNSSFANPNGLPNPDHYSTARDMAKIAAYCMQNKDFREIVSTYKTTVHWQYPENKIQEVTNTNKLLETYADATGIKTGFTRAAGGCLAAAAKRNNLELIAVVMHSENAEIRFQDAAKLLDYGFSVVKPVRKIDKARAEKVVFVRNGVKGTLQVNPESDLNFPLIEGEDEKKIKVSYKLPNVVQAEIKTGNVIGEAVVRYDGKPVVSIPMVASENIARGFSVASMIAGLAEPLLEVAQSVLAMLV